MSLFKWICLMVPGTLLAAALFYGVVLVGPLVFDFLFGLGEKYGVLGLVPSVALFGAALGFVFWLTEKCYEPLPTRAEVKVEEKS